MTYNCRGHIREHGVNTIYTILVEKKLEDERN